MQGATGPRTAFKRQWLEMRNDAACTRALHAVMQKPMHPGPGLYVLDTSHAQTLVLGPRRVPFTNYWVQIPVGFRKPCLHVHSDNGGRPRLFSACVRMGDVPPPQNVSLTTTSARCPFLASPSFASAIRACLVDSHIVQLSRVAIRGAECRTPSPARVSR